MRKPIFAYNIISTTKDINGNPRRLAEVFEVTNENRYMRHRLTVDIGYGGSSWRQLLNYQNAVRLGSYTVTPEEFEKLKKKAKEDSLITLVEY